MAAIISVAAHLCMLCRNQPKVASSVIYRIDSKAEGRRLIVQSQQTILQFQRKPDQRLIRRLRRSGNRLPIAIECAVVTRAEEAIVLGLPVNTATRLRTHAGQGEEIFRCRARYLPGNDHFRAGRRSKVQGFSFRQMIDRADNSQPLAFPAAG